MGISPSYIVLIFIYVVKKFPIGSWCKGRKVQRFTGEVTISISANSVAFEIRSLRDRGRLQASIWYCIISIGCWIIVGQPLKRCGDAKEFCAVCEVRTRLATMACAFQNVL